MTLSELLPAVRALPRAEQVQILHTLVDEIGKPAPVPELPPDLERQLASADEWPVWSPLGTPEAAAELGRLLDEAKAAGVTP